MKLTDKQVDGLRVLAKKPSLLWSHIVRSDGCWEWIGSKNKYGYGSVRVGSTSVLSHRAAFFLAVGCLNGDCVCHKCDNPACCNPSHLFLSSHEGNMLDMRKKGRRKGINCGERNGRAKLDPVEVAHIREKRHKGASLKELSSIYRVGLSTISRVCRGENWT